MGMTESALYIYPNMPSDSSYLIVRGKFRSTVGGTETDVVYPIEINHTDNTDPVKSESRIRSDSVKQPLQVAHHRRNQFKYTGNFRSGRLDLGRRRRQQTR